MVGLTCVCVYGGTGVANQITELKRGTEIVVCTPGRMIDILGEQRVAPAWSTRTSTRTCTRMQAQQRA